MENNFVYVVIDSDDRSIDSIYDEPTFKMLYKNYSNGAYWKKEYDVLQFRINAEYLLNEVSGVYPEYFGAL